MKLDWKDTKAVARDHTKWSILVTHGF